MSEIAEQQSDFAAFLKERGITEAAFAALAEDKQEYLRDVWRQERHLVSLPPDAVVAAVPHSSPPVSLAAALIPAGIALVGVVAIVLVRVLSPSAPAAVTAAPPASLPPAPAAAPPRPAPLPAETRWSLVSRAQGFGEVATAPFRIAGRKWKITWSTRPAPESPPGTFSISVRGPGGLAGGPAATLPGEGEGEMVLRGRGGHTLEIRSSQVFQVKVFDYR